MSGLTVVTVKSAQPKEKTYRLSDEKGLYIEITPKGYKYWRFKFRYGGKEKRLALGVYPEVSLAQAREARDTARLQIRDGVDPCEARAQAKKNQKLAVKNSFGDIAEEWLKRQVPHWSASHRERTERIIEKDLLPYLGERAASEITAPELLVVLRKIESRRALETCQRGRTISSQIFRFAIASGVAERDPAVDLIGALEKPVKTHFAATTDPKEVGRLLRVIDSYTGSAPVYAALRLAPMLFVRPGELRHAEWAEIDLDQAVWSIPAEKMKMREPHIVPLPKQAVEILKSLYPITGTAKYVFYTRNKNKPLSENGVNSALRYLGIEKERLTGHGFRAIARTLLDEQLGYRIDIIEHQLAHVVKDLNGRAYNRTKHLDKRLEMMQSWADYLDDLKECGT